MRHFATWFVISAVVFAILLATGLLKTASVRQFPANLDIKGANRAPPNINRSKSRSGAPFGEVFLAFAAVVALIFGSLALTNENTVFDETFPAALAAAGLTMVVALSLRRITDFGFGAVPILAASTLAAVLVAFADFTFGAAVLLAAGLAVLGHFLVTTPLTRYVVTRAGPMALAIIAVSTLGLGFVTINADAGELTTGGTAAVVIFGIVGYLAINLVESRHRTNRGSAASLDNGAEAFDDSFTRANMSPFGATVGRVSLTPQMG